MKLATKTLAGKPLSWAVAHALRMSPVVRDGEVFLHGVEAWDPASDAKQAIAVMENDGVALQPRMKMRGCSVLGVESWLACNGKNYGGLIRYYGDGPTMVLAGLRCVIQARLGDTVDVPESLIASGTAAAIEQAQQTPA